MRLDACVVNSQLSLKDSFCERFVAAGYHCIAFDYRYFGASTGQPRQLLDIPSQLADWHAAIAYARSLPNVDPDRVGLFGTSFSGGHVIQIAAKDHRIAAAISQCPFTRCAVSILQRSYFSGIHSAFTVSLRTIPRVMALAVQDAFFSKRDAPIMVPLLGGPDEPALMNAPDAAAGCRRLVPEGFPYVDHVAARIALYLPMSIPGALSSSVDIADY